MLRAVPKDRKKFDTNSEPLSEVTWEETPCLENTWRTNRHAKSADVMVLWAGIKIACLVSWSTMTKIVSNLENDGSFSMNSMVVQGWGVVWEIHRTCDIVAWMAYKWHRTCRIVVHRHRGWARSIHGRLIPVFCFDQNVRQGCDHDCTEEYMCRGYQQMVHKFCCQEGVDLLGL